MAGNRFDVVVVGARCAGAALATFLARSGARVLMVDRDKLPSDQVISTHTIHPPGVDILDELGVGGAVRSVAPVTRMIRLCKGDSWADIPLGPNRTEICPRRERLDGLLQDAAVDAGAELRDRTRAVAVLFDDGRATGVRVERDGGSEEIKARLVVGADGRRSFVAGEVGAAEYMAYDAPRAMYWAYWDAPHAWHTDRYPFDMYLAHIGNDIRVIFQTDHGQLLVGSLPAVEVARSWRGDPASALKRNLSGDPVIGPLLDGADPESSVRGTVRERYFFREGAGKGWALVGDAGHHKEFVVGDGITEALIQARSLAAAIAATDETALTKWWRSRDVAALAGYYWGRDEGALGSPAELECLVVGRVGRDDDLRRQMTRLPEHQCSPYDVLPASAVLPAFLGALLRGRFGVIPEFLSQIRRMKEYQRAMKQRTALLTRHLLILLAFLVSLPGCARGQIENPESSWVEADSVAVIEDFRIGLTVSAWRDFMPTIGDTPPGSDLMVNLVITNLDSVALPEGIVVDSAWLRSNEGDWSTAPSVEPRPDTPYGMDLMLRGGPKWSTDQTLDVLIRIQMPDGETHFLQARDQPVGRTM